MPFADLADVWRATKHLDIHPAHQRTNAAAADADSAQAQKIALHARISQT